MAYSHVRAGLVRARERIGPCSHYANTREVFIDTVEGFWKDPQFLGAPLRCGKCADMQTTRRRFSRV